MKPRSPCLAGLIATAALGLTLHAQSPLGLHLGDRANADITTPVPLDLVDPAATAALRAAKAPEVPVVFRSFPATTNLMVHEFNAVFGQTRTRFVASLAAAASTSPQNNPAAAPVDLPHLTAAFNAKNPGFPVTAELAAEWAGGGDGVQIQEKLLDPLCQAAAKPVRPDDLPDGFVPGDTVCLVSVSDLGSDLSLAEIQLGRQVPAAEVLTITAAQKMLRAGLPAAEQPQARALAAFLEPNSFPDAPASQLLRDGTINALVATQHFNPGAVIIHRGDVIDARAKAALAAVLGKLLTPRPPVPGLHYGWLILVLACVSVLAILVAWSQDRRQAVRPPQLLAAPATPLQLSAPGEDTPQLTQQLRDAVMHELALQRHELLQTQGTAADEIAALIRRLDELQLPVQERERTYEARIQVLEKELAERTAENRELLAMKIEVVRRQLESERAAHNTGS